MDALTARPSARAPAAEVLVADDPLWYQDAVIYQLHVKSFFDANNDGIGDFAGLLEKLDYIANLGVTAIWLLPFYPSPRRDDGYDIADYRGVHPDYGNLADLRRFLAAAHHRGLRIIVELVVNHTSDQHPWFQRARQAKPGSSARNFYVWSDVDTRYAGTRIIFLDTEKSNWTWDPVANAYYWHRFYSHQPDLNFDNPRVLQAILGVLHFWLDLGVDGLRLDAVPYLVERENTSNENLPETHAILKRIRAELDRHFPNRMLLAEANQWPEDTQEYFGNGDECHMAFHFPLMPRMYMALAQEDRFPITDILRQTPDIPANCQWAIFLRNHDELTLEMVTDKERDYLWEKYAGDRRARINLGIRRRLAPLLERDRRRIELLNSLLLSMPGTPVIYYGDELGMGDNIYLGDRDGVRTPMQWSMDRNAGFSRADPATLVLPPIMDPLYGFHSVNVEAQTRDPHSLLNWMRRMLGIRQRTKVFGRGSLKMLSPANRKIFAYLREWSGADGPGGAEQTVLCVANLAPSAQAVELDLSVFADRVPLEMLGGAAFPPIGKLPYLLTLPPYGFFWFLLAGREQMPAWHTPFPESLPEYLTLVLRHDLADLLRPPVRGQIERDVLPIYLPKRRWFATKDRKLQSVRIVHCSPLPDAKRQILLAEVEAHTSAGVDCYLLPLCFIPESEAVTAMPQQLALARVRRGNRVGFLTDAMVADALPKAVLEQLRAATTIAVEDGELRFAPTAKLADLELPADAEIRRLTGEQSNTSIVIGEFAIVKLIRHLRSGVHPEAEMGRYLTEHGFANIAPFLGEVTRVAADGKPYVLAVVHGFMHNQGDAWSWAQNMLDRALHAAAATPEGPEDLHADSFDEFAQFARTLGRRLGEMHVVLAQPAIAPAFAPETASAEDCSRWAASAAAQVAEALRALAEYRDWSDEGDRKLAQVLAGQGRRFASEIMRLAAFGAGSLQMRIHGDLHLGQVLISQGDAFIIDFEGEPARPLAERRSKSSPLRDVAGMIRSFDYAAAAGNASGPAPTATSAAAAPDRGALVRGFREVSIGAFLEAYREATAPIARESQTQEAADALIDLFTLEKAAYEVAYEAANRPAWIQVPLRGLAAIARRIGIGLEDNSNSGADQHV